MDISYQLPTSSVLKAVESTAQRASDMGMEQSIQSSGVFPDLSGYRIKVTGISDLQLNGEASADVAGHATDEVLVEDELQGHPSELGKPEARSTEEASPGEAQGTKGNASGEENVGQSVQEQENSGGFSVPEETPKAQVRQESQEGDQPVSAPKSVTDTVEEPKVASEIHAAKCGTGDNAEGTEAQTRDLTSSDKKQCTEQGHGLDVEGQYLEHILAHQTLTAAHEKPAGINVERELANAKVMTLLQRGPALATDETLNVTEANRTMPALGALPASPALAPMEWTSPQPSAKTWLQILETKEPSSRKHVDEAFPDEPASAKAEAPKVADSGEGWLSKEGAQIYIELAVTPGTCQAEAMTEDAEQTKGCLGDGGSPVSAEKLTDAPNEEAMVLRPLISRRKARFCCTVL